MIEVVAGVIFNECHEILACQRPPKKHLAGKWEFPGGKIEAGETPEIALIRELQEELGITVAVLSSLSPVHWDYGKGPILLRPYICRIEANQPSPIEHSAIHWISIGDYPLLDWAEADLPIFQELLPYVTQCSLNNGTDDRFVTPDDTDSKNRDHD